MSKGRTGARRPAVTVGDVLAALNTRAPFDSAAEWDNVGLLLGRPDWPATRGLLAIDVTDAVAAEALRTRCDLLVAYHPPIFKALRAVTPDAPGPTTRLPDLLRAGVSVIALHTALDAAVGGTNDVLLDVFDPVERRPLEPLVRTDRHYKLVVFVPPAEAAQLRRALAAAGAGMIGHYSECSFELAGRGTFRGDETTHPTVGRRGVLEHADEIRLELLVPRPRLPAVVRALYARHSYEEPAFDLYPLHDLAGRGTVGLGRVGILKHPQRGDLLLRLLARRVDLSAAQVIGRLNRRFASVTAAAGSCGTDALRDPAALVLTGELKHHDALQLLRRGVTAVCLGHYASERPVLDVVRAHLAACCAALRLTVARADGPPLRPLR